MTEYANARETIQNGYYGGEMEIEEVMSTLLSQVSGNDSHTECRSAIQKLRELIVELDNVCDRNNGGKLTVTQFEQQVSSLANRLMQALPIPSDD
jgi:hypothetical protein